MPARKVCRLALESVDPLDYSVSRNLDGTRWSMAGETFLKLKKGDDFIGSNFERRRVKVCALSALCALRAGIGSFGSRDVRGWHSLGGSLVQIPQKCLLPAESQLQNM
jgi:hypothetical protein